MNPADLLQDWNAPAQPAPFPLPALRTQGLREVLSQGWRIPLGHLEQVLQQDRGLLRQDLDQLLQLLLTHAEAHAAHLQSLHRNPDPQAAWQPLAATHLLMLRRAIGPEGLLDLLAPFTRLPADAYRAATTAGLGEDAWLPWSTAMLAPDGAARVAALVTDPRTCPPARTDLMTALSRHAFAYAYEQAPYAGHLRAIIQHALAQPEAPGSHDLLEMAVWDTLHHKFRALLPALAPAFAMPGFVTKTASSLEDLRRKIEDPNVHWVRQDPVPLLDYYRDRQLREERDMLNRRSQVAATLPTPKLPKKAGKVANRSKMPGRNDLCHCGSGKKFKNCHGR